MKELSKVTDLDCPEQYAIRLNGEKWRYMNASIVPLIMVRPSTSTEGQMWSCAREESGWISKVYAERMVSMKMGVEGSEWDNVMT